jgi:predicted  nucleic acid-binding Zn-ribbon protein
MDSLRGQTDEAGARAGEAASKMGETTETLRQQLTSMASTYHQAEQGIEALSKALGRRTQELSSITDVALEKVAVWDKKVRSHSDALAQTTDSVTQRANQVTAAMEYQTSELRGASNEANALLEALEGRKQEAGLEDFVHQSSFISERLQSLAVDMNRVLETTISEDDWQRFNKGETSVFVRKMLGFREKARLGDIKEKYQQDGEFREYVSRYFKEFEVLLEEAKKRDQAGLLKSTFLSSDVGKVYMLLARALGRDITAPDA